MVCYIFYDNCDAFRVSSIIITREFTDITTFDSFNSCTMSVSKAAIVYFNFVSTTIIGCHWK